MYKLKYLNLKKKYLNGGVDKLIISEFPSDEYLNELLMLEDLDTIINELILSDNRILDFRTDELILPDFLSCHEKNIILSCGDGYGIRIGSRCNITDIEFYTRISEQKYNIFCCLYNYNNKNKKLLKNIIYLREHPELEIILCLMDTTDFLEAQKFKTLFNNSISRINTDDKRYGNLSALVSHDILISGGIITNPFPYNNYYDIMYTYSQRGKGFESLRTKYPESGKYYFQYYHLYHVKTLFERSTSGFDIYFTKK